MTSDPWRAVGTVPATRIALDRAGLTLGEAGQLLGFTERTAKRHWAFARAWLYDAIKNAQTP